MPLLTAAARHLNQRGGDGRLVCPVCNRPIRVGQETVDDGVYLQHAECALRTIPPHPAHEERIVRIHVRASDWQDTAWRQRFEADLRGTGWRLLSVEPPSAEHSEYVYIVAPEQK
ncbi:MAG TPA: hypothetical protein VGT40_08540 [Methylomirabilota bacterium]|jgi:hypothetical protein|nr:hypothetical protein [Methylomirabilota bacterium]